MALPTNKILLRSPYWITSTDENLSYILVNLRVWIGDLADEPTDVTIKLKSTALNGTASVDISELARDFVEVVFGTQGEESNAVFVSSILSSFYTDGSSDTESKVYYLGLDGYGTFTDGANYSLTKRVLMSTEKIRSYKDTNNKIPVLASEFTGYRLQAKSYVGYSDFRVVTGLTPNDSTEDAVDYISTLYSGSYADRVIVENSTITLSAYEHKYFILRFVC